MRKNKGLLFLLFALLASLAMSVLVLKRVSIPGDSEVENATLTSTHDVVFLRLDIAPGAVLTTDALELRAVPANQLPADYFGRFDDLVGRVARESLLRGEPLSSRRLVPEGIAGGLSVTIPEGMRGASVSIDDVTGVSGFLFPGNRVDVLTTMGRDEDEDITYTVLQDVEVLAIDRRTLTPDAPEEAQTGRVATLLLTPEQVERLVHSSVRGRVHLSLRSPADLSEVETRGVTLETLRPPLPVPERVPVPRSVPRPVAAPAPATMPIETIHGIRREVTEHTTPPE